MSKEMKTNANGIEERKKEREKERGKVY